MLGKVLFYVSSFITAWTGLIITFKGYVIPGMLIVGFGYILFKVTCPVD